MPVAKQWVGSPNFAPGRAGYRARAIVVHIMEGTLADTDNWFNTTRSQVSAHYGIGVDGTVHQYVLEGDAAWHAGRVVSPTWALIKPGVNPNLYTLGIEHEGHSGAAWEARMLDASAALIAEAAARWVIPLDRLHVIGHCEIYAPKSFCPGSGVDLDALVARARAIATSGPSYASVTQSGQASAVVPLNVRVQAPTTTAAIARTLAPGTDFPFVGWTSAGENVHNNPHWYVDASGNWVWAGGTTAPVPLPALGPAAG